MHIPFQYNFRNLQARWARTVLTALGIGLVVAIFVVIQATTAGLRTAITTTGSPDNILIVDSGAPSIEFSVVKWEKFNQMRYQPEVARLENRELVSPEYNQSAWVKRAGTGEETRRLIVVRGARPVALAVHSQVKLTNGRLPQAAGEVALGRQVASELNVGLGDSISFGDREWTVVGLLAAPGTMFEAEIWADLDALMAHYQRTSLTSITVRLRSGYDAETVSARWNADPRLKTNTTPEVGYYAALSQQADDMTWLGLVVAGMMGVGAIFGGMNTMYTAVAGRTREIGVLRALGFSAWDVQIAFIVESVMIALCGGVLGCLFSLTANGFSVRALGTAFQMKIGVGALAWGIVLAALAGLLGGLFPARTGVRLSIIEAIRHI